MTVHAPLTDDGVDAGAVKATAARLSPQKSARTWWLAFFLYLASGTAWVASIPILLFSLGGSLMPHIGWSWGTVVAVMMFSVLVQFDQRIAAIVVPIVAFGSALQTTGWQAFAFAFVASVMTALNGVKRVCPPNPRLLNFQCRYYQGYHKKSELFASPDSIRKGRSLYACHPHGILSVGWISNVVWGRRFHELVGRCFYLIDGTLRNKGLLARPFCDAFEGPHGGLRDTSRDTMNSLMEQGESVCLIPGAYQEATRFEFGRDRVALRSRKGFIKQCLRHGYRVHPVYTFGESQTYRTLGGFENLRLRLNRTGIPTVAFWGLSWFPLLPRRGCELITCVGPALELPKIPEPSASEVDEWHAKYVTALCELFDKSKAEAGYPHAQLEVL